MLVLVLSTGLEPSGGLREFTPLDTPLTPLSGVGTSPSGLNLNQLVADIANDFPATTGK